MSLQIFNMFLYREVQIISIDAYLAVSNLNSYEDMGQELKQRDLDQGFDPDCHQALAATLGLQDH